MKNKPQTGCSLNELAAIIAKAAAPVADIVPSGWFTRLQLQKQWGCGKSCAQDRLAAAIKAGVIIQRSFTLKDGRGNRRPTPHFSRTSQ